MKKYLLTTGTIFGLFALGHLAELLVEWRPPASDPWFMAGMALIILVSGALCVWAFRLLKASGRAATLVLLLFALRGSHLVAQSRPGGSSAEDSVRAVELARGQALLRADTTALGRLVADEFFEVSRLGQLRIRADNLRDIASGELRLTAVHYDSLTVRIYGDVAVLRGIADNTGTFRGFPFAGKLRYTKVFVRRDGRWQAVAMQHTMMQ